MYCSSCGLQVVQGSRFCSGCGAVIAGTARSEADPTATLPYSAGARAYACSGMLLPEGPEHDALTAPGGRRVKNDRLAELIVFSAIQSLESAGIVGVSARSKRSLRGDYDVPFLERTGAAASPVGGAAGFDGLLLKGMAGGSSRRLEEVLAQMVALDAQPMDSGYGRLVALAQVEFVNAGLLTVGQSPSGAEPPQSWAPGWVEYLQGALGTEATARWTTAQSAPWAAIVRSDLIRFDAKASYSDGGPGTLPT